MDNNSSSSPNRLNSSRFLVVIGFLLLFAMVFLVESQRGIIKIEIVWKEKKTSVKEDGSHVTSGKTLVDSSQQDVNKRSVKGGETNPTRSKVSYNELLSQSEKKKKKKKKGNPDKPPSGSSLVEPNTKKKPALHQAMSTAASTESINQSKKMTNTKRSNASPSVISSSYPIYPNTTGTSSPVLLATFIFGRAAQNRKYVQTFIWSAATSGVDIVLVGDFAPTWPTGYELPPNIYKFTVTWNQLVDQVRDVVFNGTEPGNLRETKKMYKVIDLKPLFGVLFPKLFQDYAWWGYLDNDMIVGNLRRALTRGQRLENFDIICGIEQEYSWGPLMLYRNVPKVNNLYKWAERPLTDLFATKMIRFFDEWGGGNDRNHIEVFKSNYKSTMAGIIDHHREKLGLRWSGGNIPGVWDGFCDPNIQRFGKEAWNKTTNCNECIFRHHAGEKGEARLDQNCFGRRPCKKIVFYCHFQKFKNKVIEPSLTEDLLRRMETRQQDWRINFKSGVSLIEENGRLHKRRSTARLMNQQ